MRALVTGGAGFIGSNLADALAAAGHQVAVLDNFYSGRRENLTGHQLFELDVRDREGVEAAFEEFRPELVFHLAAQIDVRNSVSDPVFDADVNVLGALNILEAARKTEVTKFIYGSTAGAVFGNPEYLPVDEAHPVKPLCPYGASKHAFESYLYMYGANYGLRYTIIRFPNVFGPRQDPHGEAGVIAIFTDRMARGAKCTIFGDGTSTRDYLYVGDIVAANLLAIEKGDGQVYNLGRGIEVSVKEVFAALVKATGYQGEPEYAPARLGEVYRIAINSAKAQRELGWQPTVGLEEGLRLTVAHIRASEQP
jgi:UDP-glucose 4-epimerase